MTNIVEAILDTVGSILVSSGRSIGGIEPDVTIEEISRDTTFITNHPVERGAAISDHAFMMPAEVEVRCGWSDSSGGWQGYSAAVYEDLRALQQAREPFEAVTGKRVYDNMLIAALEVSTTQESEYALMVRVALREVIIVDTQTTSANPASTQADPSRTSGVTSSGAKQLQSADVQLPSWIAKTSPYL